jgi:hypothetical protein
VTAWNHLPALLWPERPVPQLTGFKRGLEDTVPVVLSREKVTVVQLYAIHPFSFVIALKECLP